MVVVMSWNVRGIISSTLCLSSLLDSSQCDIAVISEHKLKTESVTYLDSIHKDFFSFVKIEDMNSETPPMLPHVTGRGGVAILVKKSLQFSVKEIDGIKSNRIIGIRVNTSSNVPLFIFGIYMPSDSNIEDYRSELDIVASLYESYSSYGRVLLAGDFNGSLLDKINVNLVKSRMLQQFAHDYNLAIPGIDFTTHGEQYSFVQKQTMLDYILFDKSCTVELGLYKILQDGSLSITSDHLPVIAHFDFHCTKHKLLLTNVKTPAWHKATDEELGTFRTLTDTRLRELNDRELHSFEDTQVFIQDLIHILRVSAAESVPFSGYNPHTRPDWTKNVKTLHDTERTKRRVWLAEGRPRGMQHLSYREYKRAKRQFRNALNVEHDKYMAATYKDIDDAAECDIRLFWRLTKRKRSRASRIYPEIRDDKGNLHCDPTGVREAFADFFEDLYALSTDDNFDPLFKDTVEEQYTAFKSICENSADGLPGGLITADDIEPVTRKLKLRKAPGEDGITNEYIKYSGPYMQHCLAKLFNGIVACGKVHVPLAWKRGLIVPLHKGPGKAKESCNSYRPVALLPCVFKVFENVVLNRIWKFCLHDKEFPNKQQQGFLPNLGCLTASFVLHETIYHNLELGSNVYAGFLDSSKAFDTVWRKGLLYKLYKLGVDGKIWTLIDDCHVSTESCVIVNQTQSRWFKVSQGVRQGGVLSTFLYLVFINDLIDEIQTMTHNSGILNIPSSCPTLADDLSLIAIYPRTLQLMLDISLAYANKWRFKFNANKSCIMKFRAKGAGMDKNLSWTLGDTTIPNKSEFTHLGIVVNNKCKFSERIATACTKGRKSYFALSDLGSPYLNPMTMSHLYKRVVLPSVLYGCELWNGLTNTDTQRLSSFQHFVCKDVLNLPRRFRSDICESLLDILPIESEIDARKLLFLGRLCRMDSHTLPKQIFLSRLFSYVETLSENQCGFIPDIMEIIHKYELSSFLLDWIQEGNFPDKNVWKNIVRNCVSSAHIQFRSTRMLNDTGFAEFCSVFTQSAPHTIWKAPSNYNDIAVCKFICKLYVFPDIDSEPHICPLCNAVVYNIFRHASILFMPIDFANPRTVLVRHRKYGHTSMCRTFRLTERRSVLGPAGPPYKYADRRSLLPYDELSFCTQFSRYLQ